MSYPISEAVVVIAASIVFFAGWTVMVKRFAKTFAGWYANRIRARALARARMMYES